jgi:hypothetical protein
MFSSLLEWHANNAIVCDGVFIHKDKQLMHALNSSTIIQSPLNLKKFSMLYSEANMNKLRQYFLCPEM